MKTATILVLVFAAGVIGASEKASDSVSFDSRFVSPNGYYAVDFVVIDKEHHFRITDLKTGRVDDSIVMPSLVLYLRWSADSRAFVTVEHISGGSYARVVCFKDDKWTSLELTPPGHSTMNFKVVSLDLKADSVHVRLSVDYEKGNGIPFSYMFYDSDINLQTCELSEIQWTPISRTEWLRSLKRQPNYSPPMREHL